MREIVNFLKIFNYTEPLTKMEIVHWLQENLALPDAIDADIKKERLRDPRGGQRAQGDHLKAPQINQKTVQRDIQLLKKKYGAPIEYSSKKGFYLTDPEWTYDLELDTIDPSQIKALMLATELLGSYKGSPMDCLLKQLVETVQGLCSEKAPVKLSGHDSAVLKGLLPANRRNREDNPEEVDLALRADELRKSGKYKSALEVANLAIKINPDHLMALTARTSIHEAMGKHGMALLDTGRILKLAGKVSWVSNDFLVLIYLTRAQAYTALSRYNESIKEALLGLKIKPSNTELLSTVAFCCCKKGQHERAIQYASQSLAIDPDNRLALFARTISYLYNRRLDLGEQDASRLLKQLPEDEVMLTIRATVYKVQGRFEETIQDATKSLATNPNNEMARNIRAAAYMCTSRYEEAIRDAKRILQLDPEDEIALKTIDDAHNALKKN
jgi:tetratricopeptide (TPR) repeat protein